MTRKSIRELERAVEDLREASGLDDDPDDIWITHTRVATTTDEDGHATVDDAGEPEVESVEHIWREGGEWHAETLDPADVDVGNHQ